MRIGLRGCGWVVCVLGLWVGGTAYGQVAVKGTAGTLLPVLMLSDIHFDPFRDAAKVPRLAAAGVEEWDAILKEPNSAGQAAGYAAMQASCKARGDDTDILLLNVSLRAAKAQAVGVRFVTVSGDLLVHGFGCRYDLAMNGNAVLNTPEGYASFAEKTASYVMNRVGAAFAGVPVYAALGNNDSSCGDYAMSVGDRFFAGTSAAVLRGLRGVDAAEAKRVQEEYEKGGYYSVSLGAGMEKTRLVVVDDIFMARAYTTCAKASDKKEAEAETAWLDGELTAAEQRGERVWVLGHIPPVVDIYNTVRRFKDVCGGASAEMFLGSNGLGDTIAKHGAAVRLAIFGHTHMDELRLLGGVPVKLVPSISPVDGNTPAFTVGQVDAATAGLVDYAVFTMPEAGGKWPREYGFRETYGVEEFSGKTLRGLIDGFQADRNGERKTSQAYERSFSAETAGAKGSLLSLVWPQYGCALDHTTAAGYRECVCKTAAQ